ncbi:hypothetical protein ABFS83_06G018800 [Erythranthe nasuta]
MDTAQWPQGIGVVKAVEDNSKSINGGHVEKKPRPDKDQPVNCPRCNSTNTKFCYYNNYSLTQPRYFCKTCRRYWTAGGSLRNVPVGGGSRKNKRSSSSSSSSSAAAAAASKKILTDLAPPIFSTQNPKIGNDLNLAYNPTSSYYSNDYVAGLPFGLGNKNFNPRNPNNLDLLKSSSSTTGNFMASFMNINNNNNNIQVSADPNPVYSTGFGGGGGVHDYKPSLGFSLDGIDQTGYGNNNNNNNNILQNHHHHNNANIPSTILFPFEELKPVSATDEFERQDNDHGGGGGGQDGEITNGYWNGMLAGGSW